MIIQFSRIFLLVMIGIGGLGPRSEAAPTPCSLLTAAEVEQVVGKLMGTPKAGEEGRAAWCNYEFANGTDAIEVWVFPADGIERARKEAKKPTALKGLGEDAFLNRGMHDSTMSISLSGKGRRPSSYLSKNRQEMRRSSRRSEGRRSTDCKEEPLCARGVW